MRASDLTGTMALRATPLAGLRESDIENPEGRIRRNRGGFPTLRIPELNSGNRPIENHSRGHCERLTNGALRPAFPRSLKTNLCNTCPLD